MNESQLQKKCIDYAKSQGWLAFKWASPAHRGVPDVIFMKGGRLIIVEFKSPTGKGGLSPLQKKTITDIKEVGGFPVFVVDNAIYFEGIIKRTLK